MFRAALFSIVLTLAAGPSAAQLCQVWCDSHDATAAGCRHERPATSPRVSAGDNCSDAALDAIAFVRGDVRRTASDPDAPTGLVVVQFQLAPPPTDARAGYASQPQVPLEARPLVIALRI